MSKYFIDKQVEVMIGTQDIDEGAIGLSLHINVCLADDPSFKKRIQGQGNLSEEDRARFKAFIMPILNRYKDENGAI